MEPQTQTWTIGEFHFTVDTAGPASGPPVLLLHGFPETRRVWRDQLRALAAAGFRAVAPDQRGYSAGARPREVEAYASDRLTSAGALCRNRSIAAKTARSVSQISPIVA